MPVVWAEQKLISPMEQCFNPVSMSEKKKKKNAAGPCENSIFIIFNARKKKKSTD